MLYKNLPFYVGTACDSRVACQTVHKIKMKKFYISLLNLLENIIDFLKYPIVSYFVKFKDFKAFYTIKTFVLGGSRGGGHISMV